MSSSPSRRRVFDVSSPSSTSDFSGHFSAVGNQWIGNKLITGGGNVYISSTQPATTNRATNIPTKLFSVPFRRDESFIDRQAVFDRIELEVSNARPAILCGLGGIGKSQIAIEYAYRFRNWFPESHVLWVYAMTRESVLQSYQELAIQLNLLDLELLKPDPCQLVKSWLRSEQRLCDSGITKACLLIIDNFDSDFWLGQSFAGPNGETSDRSRTADYTLLDLLPTNLSSSQQLLVTTRTEEVARAISDVGCRIEPGRFSVDEAMILLKTRLNGKEDHSSPKAAIALLQKLDYIPLAITQAAAYMVRNRVSIPQYLTSLEAGDARLDQQLGAELQDPRRSRGWPNSVFQTWKLTFDCMEANFPDAAGLLSRLSVVSTQHIPRQLIQQNNVAADMALGTLFGYSLVSFQPSSETISLHPLVAASVRYWLRQSGRFEAVAGEVLKVVKDVFPDVTDDDYMVWCRIRQHYTTLAPHIDSVLNLHQQAGLPPVDRLDVLIKCVRCDLAIARYASALGHAQAAHAELRDHRRETGPRDFCMKVIVADALSRLGCSTEAIELLTQAIEDYKDHERVELEHVLEAKECLALVLMGHGSYPEARQTQVEYIEGLKSAFGEESKEVFIAQDKLIRISYEAGKHDEAICLQQERLETSSRLFGWTSSASISVALSLSDMLLDAHRYCEAISILETILPSWKKTAGPNSQTRINTVWSLSAAYFHTGQWNKAKVLLREIIEDCEALWCSDHGLANLSREILELVENSQKRKARKTAARRIVTWLLSISTLLVAIGCGGYLY